MKSELSILESMQHVIDYINKQQENTKVIIEKQQKLCDDINSIVEKYDSSIKMLQNKSRKNIFYNVNDLTIDDLINEIVIYYGISFSEANQIPFLQLKEKYNYAKKREKESNKYS